MRDVTKTKPSHHRGASTPVAAAKATWPTSLGGILIANEVQACAGLSNETKAKLVREIMEHEAQHAEPTQTFLKKIRRQLRSPAA